MPLLMNGSDDISIEELQASFEAEKATEGRRKAFKTGGVVVCYCITVFSQVNRFLSTVAGASFASHPAWSVYKGFSAFYLPKNSVMPAHIAQSLHQPIVDRTTCQFELFQRVENFLRKQR